MLCLNGKGSESYTGVKNNLAVYWLDWTDGGDTNWKKVCNRGKVWNSALSQVSAEHHTSIPAVEGTEWIWS